MPPAITMPNATMSLRALRVAVLGASYAALTLMLHPISYGPLQIRVADVLSPLPYVMGFDGVAGVTLGTLVANLFSPYGVWDIVVGTLCTLTYSLINWWLGRTFGYRRALLPLVAVLDSVVVGLFIGVLLLGLMAEAGDPVYLFLLLTGESLVPMSVGALVVVPLVRRRLALRR